MENLDRLPTLYELQALQLREVGLIWISDLAEKLPNLQALDVSNNKIYSLKNLDEMNALESLVEVNI
jgi:Leucine-rich repeat (LRR) protein